MQIFPVPGRRAPRFSQSPPEFLPEALVRSFRHRG